MQVLRPILGLRPVKAAALAERTVCLRCSFLAAKVPPTRQLISGSRRRFSSKPPSSSSEHGSTDESGRREKSERAGEDKTTTDGPSTLETHRAKLSERLAHAVDTLQARAVHAGDTLNSLTGYTPIEAIKRENAVLETELSGLQTRVRTARASYKSATARRASTQREVTTLLARKDSWSPLELERFTELYRMDHALEGEVVGAAAELGEAENEEQRTGSRLMQGILRRYHEEQVWSDRIRRMSTWGTWGLMGVNVVLFLVLQFGAEPWRRRRLVRGVGMEVEKGLEEVRAGVDEIRRALEGKVVEDGVLAGGTAGELEQEVEREVEREVKMEGVGAEMQGELDWARWRGGLASPGRWRGVLEELASEKGSGLRVKDATLLVLEGLAAGVVLGGGIVAVAWRLQ